MTMTGLKAEDSGLSVIISTASPEIIFSEAVKFSIKLSGASTKDTKDYSFWLDCSDESTDYNHLSSANICGNPSDENIGLRKENYKGDVIIPAQSYASAGQYTAKILIEKDGQVVEDRVEIKIKPGVDLKANGVFDQTAEIPYGDNLELSWKTMGLSETDKCISSWGGEKSTEGTEIISNIKDLNNDYVLTCTGKDGISNSDTLIAKVIPKVKINSDQTINNTNYVLAHFNKEAGFSWESFGVSNDANPCVGKGSDSSWSGKQVPARGSFVIQSVTDSRTYSLECSGPNGKAEASIVLKVEKGNCAFAGNSTIKAVFFCQNDFAIINNGNNADFTGSFVARAFNLPEISKNIRFYYQANLDNKWPPGFRELNLPYVIEKSSGN